MSKVVGKTESTRTAPMPAQRARIPGLSAEQLRHVAGGGFVLSEGASIKPLGFVLSEGTTVKPAGFVLSE